MENAELPERKGSEQPKITNEGASLPSEEAEKPEVAEEGKTTELELNALDTKESHLEQVDRELKELESERHFLSKEEYEERLKRISPFAYTFYVLQGSLEGLFKEMTESQVPSKKAQEALLRLREHRMERLIERMRHKFIEPHEVDKNPQCK